MVERIGSIQNNDWMFYNESLLKNEHKGIWNIGCEKEPAPPCGDIDPVPPEFS